MDNPDTTFRAYVRKPFDAEGCTRCGQCLATCPVMHLPEEEAVAEVKSLIRSHEDATYRKASTERVLTRCTSCFACNVSCPEDCRPANLFLDIWHQRYRDEGLPARAAFFLPHSRPNFRTYVMDRLPADEAAVVTAWGRLEPADTIFFPGCNILTTPYLTFSRMFEGLDIRGGLDYCCGEMYFRMGLYEQVEQVAAKLTAYFKSLQVRRVHMLCTAGLNLFSNILPQFGADFTGITFVPFLKYIHERIESGAWPVVKRFDGKTIAIQDSCHAKILEPGYWEWPRKVLEAIGFTVVEAPQSGEAGLCCGIGSGFSHGAAYGKPDMVLGQRACVQNAGVHKTDYVGVYCSGCLSMMTVARFSAWTAPPVHHVVELVQEAIGETPLRRQGSRARHFLAGTLMGQKIVGKRFFVPPIG